ncbi:MAG: hypothetical protein ACYSWU_27440, partial [Planctomycetota bacterium]
MKRLFTILAAAGVFLAAAVAAQAASHTLFLDFGPDNSFPEFSFSTAEYTSSPLYQFDANQLGSGFGASETTQIDNNVLSIVRVDYDEFDLYVTKTAPASGTYQTLGIDHTTATYTFGGNTSDLFGQADDVDNDAHDGDYARVWAGSFSAWSSAWQGTNSTVARWSRAIGETAAHEAGHNYGLGHADSALTFGETAAGDSRNNHVMATGSTGLGAEERATINRHFSDTSYGILAANLGLKAATLSNWDSKNPNDVKAHDFHIKFYSKHSSLNVQWEYSGDPFGTPTVTGLGQKPYKGEQWYQYEVVWSGGSGVPAGNEFHTGITFQESNDFVITDTLLTDSVGGELPLKPRMISYGSGDTAANGDYSIPLSNNMDLPLILRDVRFRLMPRMVDLETMTAEFRDNPMTRHQLPVYPLGEIRITQEIVLTPGEETRVVLGNLDEWLAEQPRRELAPGEDGSWLFPEYLLPLVYRDMFPSTYIYGTASVVLPEQEIWDPELQRFVQGDL